MEAVRHWLLQGCSGCILYGLLENLLPRRGVYPVIKAVVTLYILLVLLSPVHSIGDLEVQLPQLPEESAAAALPGQTQQQFWDTAAGVLQAQLTEALASAGCRARLLAVVPQTDGDTLLSVELRLSAQDSADKAAAQALCDSLLELPAAYIWENV